MCFAIVSFLLAYVVPKVVAVFESSHQELPLATRVLIGMSDFFRHYWIYVLVAHRRGGLGLLALAAEPGGATRGSIAFCCGCRSSASSSAASIPRASRAPSAS